LSSNLSKESATEDWKQLANILEQLSFL
jgi:hypothetical protein